MSDINPLIAAEEPCATADELLDRLAPQHPGWKSGAHNWIYRGQSRDLPLLAKAHRDEGVFKGFRVDLTAQNDESARQVRDRVEVQLIQAFVSELERAGIEVPPDRRSERRHLTSGLIYDRDFQLVPDEIRALAQHHGIPTAMLDWSTQSLKAAYFGAAGAAREPGEGNLIVWALHRGVDEARISHQDFAIVTPPPWTNRQMFAQAGTFTHHSTDRITPIDQYLPQILAVHAYVKDTVPFPWMRKLSAPRTCAPKLLRLLASYGITGASMFPGHDGVVRAMRERALWDLP